MAQILVCYGTSEGQTEKIAERIGDRLSERGHRAPVRNVDESDPDPGGYDAVLIGSSIHMGGHQSPVETFITENLEVLGALPTGFFQVSLSAASDDPGERAEAANYVEDFEESTGFHPDRVGLFGGALRYSKYGFLKRLLMKQIAKRSSGDTDTSRDYEYTDWGEVDAFAADFAAFVEGRLGERSPGEE
ncbi:flavodoxin domain-containing protein [Halorhabdus amylolytica]|uniref:flavodoxin domain-containing protein n=1 Tax=Halorhabdus amylolytica TaxID=2559573 RepID=UPI0010AABAA5|nr:flavodoxin domain-containing protein [Halorhabdus amylolytica]